MAYADIICLLSASFLDANMIFAGGRWPPIGDIFIFGMQYRTEANGLLKRTS